MAHAATPAHELPWQKVREDATLQVWTRQRPSTKVHEIKAERLVEAPPERLWQVLSDVAHYTEFMPYVVESRVVVARHSDAIEYFRIKPPLLKPRDYTVQTTIEADVALRRFVRRWHTANQQGPPQRRDSVRLQLCDGSWTIEAYPGNRSKVSYWVFTDPAGSVPSWLVNRASQQSIPEMLDAVAERARDPNFQR